MYQSILVVSTPQANPRTTLLKGKQNGKMPHGGDNWAWAVQMPHGTVKKAHSSPVVSSKSEMNRETKPADWDSLRYKSGRIGTETWQTRGGGTAGIDWFRHHIRRFRLDYQPLLEEERRPQADMILFNNRETSPWQDGIFNGWCEQLNILRKCSVFLYTIQILWNLVSMETVAHLYQTAFKLS